MTEVIGSGPFKYDATRFVAGSRSVFTKNEKYVPRDEPANYTSGGLRVMVDRVEWRVIPDAATAATALMAGEVDWLETPLPDLVPMLRRSSGVTVAVLDRTGNYGGLRPNWEQGPTANLGVRQAMLAAIDQVEVMTAAMGGDKSFYNAPVGIFIPGSPGANDSGMDLVRTRKSIPDIKAMLRDAGYKGERVVLLHPTDQIIYNAMVGVVGQAFGQIGLTIDEIATDWGTVVERRTSHEPIEKGGWSMFPSSPSASEYVDPLLPPGIRGNGKKAFFGWPSDDKLEALRDQWLDETDPANQKQLCEQIQARCLDVVTIIPLGQYLTPTAWTKKISPPLKGVGPVFWNITKS